MMIVLVFPQQRHQFGAGRHFPDLDVLVVASASQHEAVGRKGQAAAMGIIAGKRQLGRFTCFGIPEANRAVFATSYEGLSVRGKYGCADVACVPTKRSEQTPCLNVPDAHEPIDTGACEGQAVGRIGHGPDAVRVASERLNLPRASLPVLQKVHLPAWNLARGGEAGVGGCRRLSLKRVRPLLDTLLSS